MYSGERSFPSRLAPNSRRKSNIIRRSSIFHLIPLILTHDINVMKVKGGGHSSNPGFSSTAGVQISMSRFGEVIYDEAAGTVEIGAGLIWDDVYEALAPYAVNVVGGRVTGVGVAGFTLGGGACSSLVEFMMVATNVDIVFVCDLPSGYSWKSNQYGLTVDTIQAYELVLPNGTVTTVTSDNDDLFWALKVRVLLPWK